MENPEDGVNKISCDITKRFERMCSEHDTVQDGFACGKYVFINLGFYPNGFWLYARDLHLTR